MTLNLDQCPRDNSRFPPYIPEDFANFETYNASLENHEGLSPSRCESKGSQCGDGTGEREVPRSPTASSCTSGYFSNSASNATLSDMPFSASESSDHLSCTSRDPSDPAARGCTQTKSASVDRRDEQQTCPVPHNCVPSANQEFTDFKGAEDSIGDSDLEHFTGGWEHEGLDRGTRGTGNHSSSDTSGVIDASVDNAGCVCVAVSRPDSPVVRPSVRAPVSAPDKAAAPSTAAPTAVARLPAAPSQRAGGEPPIEEPAQGDLPHGSPCPSPNPSSAEPSGDSSGEESTPVAQLPDWMAPGEQVWVGKRRGTVYYVGGVEFAKGIWIGVKLDMAVGKSTFC